MSRILTPLLKTEWVDLLRSLDVRDVSSFTSVVMFFSSAVVLADVFLQRVYQGGAENASVVTWIALGGVALSCLMWTFFRITGRNEVLPVFSGRLSPSQRTVAKSFAISFHLALLLLIPTAHLAVWKNHNHFIDWYQYGFLDKRWLFSVYWIAILTFVFFPPLIHRILDAKNLSVTSDFVDSAEGKGTRKTVIALKLVLALGLSLFLFGPPWNIDRTPLFIDFHEQVHLGPLQAIHEGYLPNIGPASQQYGAGTQWLTYAYMVGTDQFDLIGFRQAQSLFFWVGFSFFTVIAFLCLDVFHGLLAVFISLSVSPFHLTYWNKFGGFNMWGWPNPLRYLGVLLVVVALAFVLMKWKTKRRVQVSSLLLGCLWGMFIWISPENLVIGIVAGGLLACLLWATETVSFGEEVVVGINVVAGGIVFWSPIFLYYGLHGCLGEFVENIFLVGQQVLAGASNIPTSGSILNVPGHKILFYGFTPFMIILGWIALYKNIDLRRPLTWDRALLLCLVSVSAASYFGSLTRTDIYHLLNVLVGLPLLLAYAIKAAPSFLFDGRRHRVFAKVTLAVVLFLVAFSRYDTSWYVSRLKNPWRKYADFFQADEVPKDLIGRSFSRTGYRKLPSVAALEPAVTPRDESSLDEMFDFFVLMDDIGLELEGKKAYVQSIPTAAPGLAYFLADITPPPILLDPYTMIFSSEVKARFLAHFETILSEVHCIVSDEAEYPSPEVDLFLRFAPNAIVEQRPFKDTQVLIICR